MLRQFIKEFLLGNAPLKGFLKRLIFLYKYKRYWRLLLRIARGGGGVLGRVEDECALLEKLNYKKYEIDCFVDVGANVGQNTLAVFIYFDGAVPVIALEPSLLSYKKLEYNVSGLENIFLFDVGVGRETGTMAFKISHSSETSQASTFLNFSERYIKRYPNQAEYTERHVEMIKLDELMLMDKFRSFNRIALHMDVEGYEGYVLEGACGLLGSRLEVIDMEITFDLFEGSHNFEDIYNMVKDQYEFKGCINDLVVDSNGSSLYQDVLFVKKKN